VSTAAALREGARDARRAWGTTQWACAALVALVALIPWLGIGWIRVDELAAWLYLALAATGLVATVGFAGLPSLGQGAFMSVGAFATALLAARAGWPAMAALPLAVAASLAAAFMTGLAIVRLPPLFVAVSTWLLTWLVAIAAAEFPWLSGGSQGYVVSSPLGTRAHYELALVLTVVAVGLLSVYRASSHGIRLRAVRDSSPAATVLGVPGDRLLFGAFVVSAGVAGVAGALSVQLAGVSDPNAFGPFTSFRLLVAVLLGGASYAAAGVVGVAILGALSLLGHAWGAVQGHAPAQLQPMLTAMLLLAVLGLGREGLLEEIAERRRARRLPGTSPAPAAAPRPAALAARGLAKAYGGVHALDGFDLEVAPGEAVALVGANGSGKTTALRALGGAVALDGGEILLDGRAVGGGPAVRASEGIVRTLQRTAVFGSLSALDSVVVGAALHARYAGPVRAVAATPKARGEAPTVRGAALDALRLVGLEGVAAERADHLDGFQQRRLMLAAALAARPRLLLLDEPSAGASPAELPVLVGILRRVKAEGVSLVIVEHNLRLVRAVADRVLTMADGKVA
jgi:branched-chain amino acid transport system permease protein